MMNLMGYDAMTIGNHEFDFGLENMAELFRMADFPVVCSNYDVTGYGTRRTGEALYHLGARRGENRYLRPGP